MDWQQRAKRKRDSLYQLIPPEWRFTDVPNPTAPPNVIQLVALRLNRAERQITESNVEYILKALAVGDLTSQEVLRAFCHRASLAHQFTNCLSEINFENALKYARDLDAYWRDHHRPIGPLHGLPVSVMDRFNVDGLESACGFVSWLGSVKTAESEGVLIRTLRQLGAVVFCKTNVPMSMMMGETVNNVIGSTGNPYNRKLSAGGACGGEGALLALQGSPLGFATDIAGSSRIPSAFCGLYALKTSEGRLPQSGTETIFHGLPIAAGSVGLMSGRLDILSIALKSLLDATPWHDDIDVLELPWRQEKLESIRRRKNHPADADGRLVLGMLETDDLVMPDPAIRRGLALVKEAMKTCGYEIIPWTPPAHSVATETLFKIFGATAGKPIRDAIDASGEPAVSQLRGWYEQHDAEPITTEDFWELCRELQEFRKQYAQYWRSTSAKTSSGREIDGVILPVSPSTALPEGTYRYFGYSAVANALNYSSGVFPVAFGSRTIDQVSDGQSRRDTAESMKQGMCIDEDVEGLPIGLQVMCQPHQEEKVLGLMEAISGALAQAT